MLGSIRNAGSGTTQFLMMLFLLRSHLRRAARPDDAIAHDKTEEQTLVELATAAAAGNA